MTWHFRVAPDPATKQPRVPWSHQLESFAIQKDRDRADDVSPELALATIESVAVLGAFRASEAVKRALAGRIQ